MIHGRLRSVAWRLGRRLYCWARGDLANDPNLNGEYWLLSQLTDHANSGGVFLDVGANVGEWSLHALAVAASANLRIRVFAFEPCSATRDMLRQALRTSENVEVVPVALAAAEGEADFFSRGAGMGTNSLHEVSGPASERVRLTTLDRFLEERDIDRVTVLKIDTEGFDFEVMKGADHALTHGRIDLVQFEYNWRWLLNKASLREVFHFVKGKPYRVGKLAGKSIHFYEDWHPELDRYFENNYVLVRRNTAMERLGQPFRFDDSNVAIPDCVR